MTQLRGQQKLHVIGGRSHPALTAAVMKHIGGTQCAVTLDNFANGEISCRLGESVRGSAVFVLQTHSPNVNDMLMEQAIIIDAARRASADSITAVCPFMSYARQDRKSSGREPITARLVIDILAAAGADRIMSVDLHAGQIQGFFNGPFDHLVGMPILANYIRESFAMNQLVIVSPDAGRAKTAERYSSLLGCGMAIIHKQRSYVQHNSVEAKYLIGDVAEKICVVIDDMIDTAGTICAAADLLSQNGAKAIYAVATHGVLSDPAMERIEQSAFKKVVVTDSLPIAVKSKKLIILSIAPLLAQAIDAVYSGNSVSALFDGRNQF
jgi:ribose-phosphate pyrophosphokinase